MTGNSQKFIARNRAPRVQIEYDVELYGSEKKVQLPFVMGVMSDLAGKSKVPQPAIEDRSFLEIDVDNFDERMRAMAPRAAFSVPNTLTGEGNIAIDLTFEKMDDFSPAAIAANVDSLRPLLEARTQLSDLMAYMDGKAGAESLIEKILADPTLLSAVSSSVGGSVEQVAALDSLRALTPEVAPEQDTTTDVLADLKTNALEGTPEQDTSGDVLAGLASQVVEDTPVDDSADVALEGLRAAVPQDAPPDTGAQDTLAALADIAPQETDTDDATVNALSSLADVELPDEVEDTTDELLAGLADTAPEPEEESDITDDLLADLAASAPESTSEPDAIGEALDSLADVELPVEVEDTTDELLANLAEVAPESEIEPDKTADALESLADLDLPDEAKDTTDGLLADLAANAPDSAPVPDSIDDALDSLADIALPEEEEDTTDDLLAELSEAPLAPDMERESSDEIFENLAEEAAVESAADNTSDLDDLLNDLGGGDDSALDDLLGESAEDDPSDLDNLLGDLGDDGSGIDIQLDDASDDDASDLDELLGDLGSDEDNVVIDQPSESGDSDTSDLDDLLSDLGGSDDSALDDLLGGSGDGDSSDLDDLLGDLGGDGGDLDDLLGDLGDDTATGDDPTSDVAMTDEPEFAFGQMSAERPGPEKLNRKRFRLAILGDFSGRAAQGRLETGDALAARKPILLDPDTVEDVIEGFATDLVLPIGKDGVGVAVKLGGLDDLHPDELYENVDLFAELVGLRGQLSSGATAENAAKQLREWGEKHGQHVVPTQARSSGNTVRADFKLSDFQKLIGDTGATLTQASPLDDLMARIVGPHIRAIPDADAMAMQGAVDEALSAAMRLVLHHPEFQSVEAQWRSIDLIARSIETDDTLDVILYDISAEEIAADLAASDDLEQSGFARLLTEEPLDEENGRGGYSALIGLYTFEETPPHAELLGRIARLAAHVDAPFITAITPGFLDIPKEDRHKLVAEAWDTLRAMPEAGHLGLVSPRFLLRRPYGAKSEPIYEFEFEEFTMAEGLKGMLWANPVVLVAILLAKSFREHGASMSLGSIMSLGDMPYHYVDDQFGDQVALPCTERNLTLDKIEGAVTRGIMSVASIKGRDEIRLTSFGSLAGGEILGPWTGAPPPKPSPPTPEPAGNVPEELDSDDGSGDDMDLDDLLADFGDNPDLGGDDDDTDAELAALLGDL